MDGDGAGGCLVLAFVLLALVSGLLHVVGFLVEVLFWMAAVAASGLATNLALRFLANHLFDWRKIREGWIWLVICGLAAVPVVVGLVLAPIPPLLALVADDISFLAFWFVIAPIYLLWLGGYVFAWFDPRFEYGSADVLMSSTLIYTWTRFQMWWECKRVQWGLF
jgi:hypothetical protein